MALVIAFDEAKLNRRKREKGSFTQFFGSRNNPNPDLPLASLNQHNEGYFTGPHFHTADQFQVVVEGEGKIGRHALAPYAVHFTRAYTPYGPLVSNPGSGLTFFVMRAHPEPGPQHLPQELPQLRQVRDRQPWQISRFVTIPTVQPDASVSDVMLQAVPDMKDEHGLSVYTLSMKPDARTYAPDPSRGDGQYLVVVKGSLLYQNKEHKALALVFVYPTEGRFQLQAGSQGLEALVLNFPSRQTRASSVMRSVQTVADSRTWKCALCSFVYSEAAGSPEDGIAPGTSWHDVPESWACPDCGASKEDFEMVELQN